MKYLLYITLSLFICFCSCTNSTNNMVVNNNKITLYIDYPTSSMVEIGQTNWPNLDNALSDLFNMFHGVSSSFLDYNQYYICVTMRSYYTDKYGKTQCSFSNEVFIDSVKTSDMRQFTNAEYMQQYYSIKNKIRTIAMGDSPYKL